MVVWRSIEGGVVMEENAMVLCTRVLVFVLVGLVLVFVFGIGLVAVGCDDLDGTRREGASHPGKMHAARAPEFWVLILTQAVDKAG